MQDNGIIIERSTLAEIIDLRHAILRAGLPRETAIFSGDEAATSRHYAGRTNDGRVVGCATFHLNKWQDEPAWQLRGMATSDELRRHGLGRAMLEFAEREILGEKDLPSLFWCNARVPAVGFYQRMGWETVSEVFEIPTAGPHMKMVRRLLR